MTAAVAAPASLPASHCSVAAAWQPAVRVCCAAHESVQRVSLCPDTSRSVLIDLG